MPYLTVPDTDENGNRITYAQAVELAKRNPEKYTSYESYSSAAEGVTALEDSAGGREVLTKPNLFDDLVDRSQQTPDAGGSRSTLPVNPPTAPMTDADRQASMLGTPPVPQEDPISRAPEAMPSSSTPAGAPLFSGDKFAGDATAAGDTTGGIGEAVEAQNAAATANPAFMSIPGLEQYSSSPQETLPESPAISPSMSVPPVDAAAEIPEGPSLEEMESSFQGDEADANKIADEYLADSAETLSLSEAPEYVERMRTQENTTGELGLHRDSRDLMNIGYGFNIEDSGARATFEEALGIKFGPYKSGKKVLSQAQADTLLVASIIRAEDDARKRISNFDALPQEIREAVTDMSYQMGSTALGGFTDFIDALEAYPNNIEGVIEGFTNSDYYKKAKGGDLKRVDRNLELLKSGYGSDKP